MQELIVNGDTQMVAGIMSCCGSTAARYYGQSLFYHAEGIVYEAVPEEGELHPQRAHFEEEGRAVFLTPGGVKFTVAPCLDGRQLTVVVEYGRDRRFLARQMLASLAISHPTYPISVDGEATTAGLALAASLVDACQN